MPLTNDLNINAAKFDPSKIDETTKAFNEKLIEIGKKGPKWFEVGAAKYREMRFKGETAFPAPKILDSGSDFEIPSRDAGRTIPCRVFRPAGSSKGAFVHIHGGGWVLGGEKSQDTNLKYLADTFSLTVISIGYRLAPENPWPACAHDCYDATEYLIDNAQSEYGAPVKFISGESAGGHLSLLTALHLLTSRPTFSFAGLVLHYGCFSLNFLPSALSFTLPLVLPITTMLAFRDALLPGYTHEQRESADISPLYADLAKWTGKLPPALFTVGTMDPLVDDSVWMAEKWGRTGARSVLRVYEGAPHGFSAMPEGSMRSVGDVRADEKVFIEDLLG